MSIMIKVISYILINLYPFMHYHVLGNAMSLLLFLYLFLIIGPFIQRQVEDSFPVGEVLVSRL